MGLIFLDSCIVVYIVEPRPPWSDTVAEAMVGYRGRRFCVSSLVKAECFVGPLKTGNLPLQADYELFFSGLTTLEMPESVFLDAGRIRARFGLKMVDALHLACAQHHSCDALLTNDTRLNAAAGGLARVLKA